MYQQSTFALDQHRAHVVLETKRLPEQYAAIAPVIVGMINKDPEKRITAQEARDQFIALRAAVPDEGTCECDTFCQLDVQHGASSDSQISFALSSAFGPVCC